MRYRRYIRGSKKGINYPNPSRNHERNEQATGRISYINSVQRGDTRRDTILTRRKRTMGGGHDEAESRLIGREQALRLFMRIDSQTPPGYW
jgi:hypothetical protein